MRNKHLNDTTTKETDYFDEYKWANKIEERQPNSLKSPGKAPENDEVNNPSHYNKGAIECIDAIEAMLTPEEFVGYLRGNSLKYRWRFRYKNNPVSDLSKASWYEQKLFNSYTKTGEFEGGQKSGKNGSI